MADILSTIIESGIKGASRQCQLFTVQHRHLDCHSYLSIFATIRRLCMKDRDSQD
jgi:hypothetical protein